MSPTKSQILGTDPLQVLDLIDEWKTAFATLEDQAETYKGYVERPGGSTWEGRTAEAASQRALQDFRAVSGARDLVDTAAREISNTVTSELMPALGNAKQIIANAERYDVVTVHEDLSVTYDPPEGTSEETVAHNRKVVADTEQDLRDAAARWWAAEQEAARQITELQTALGDHLNFAAALADVNAIVAEAAGAATPLPGQSVVKASGTTDESGTARTWQDMLLPSGVGSGAPAGPVSPLDVLAGAGSATNPDRPANVDDALDVVAGQQVPASPTLSEQILNPRHGTGKPGDPRYTKSPLEAPVVAADPSVVALQHAKVADAEQNLAGAQAALDGAADQAYTQGPGAGPGQDETLPLSQAVFDARADLTEQTELLTTLNAAAAEAGLPTAAVSELPANAEVQAFPAQPPAVERALDALTEGTKDAATTAWDLTMPDVVNMYEVATDPDNATDAQKQQAAIDTASLIPLPGAKILGEIVERGLDALGLAGRHIDDVPTAAADNIADTADAPSIPHAPTQHSFTPDAFDPGRGQHYTSGDAHHPGGWPPGTPDATWSKGATDPGWHYIDRGPDKQWMPYQEQISGAERLPDGRIPEYARVDPDTGRAVNFDGHDVRGTQEVFLDAKDGYAKLATEPGKPWTQGMERTILDEVPRQLRAIPEGAALEIHVSDPAGAAAIRQLLSDNFIYGADVIYTPRVP